MSYLKTPVTGGGGTPYSVRTKSVEIGQKIMFSFLGGKTPCLANKSDIFNGQADRTVRPSARLLNIHFFTPFPPCGF